MSDIDTLARTLYGEARGEGDIGMKAVACVILNRAAIGLDHPHFGNGSIESACQAPWQFSCWNANDPNCETIQNITEDDPSFAKALQIASDAMNGDLEDMTGGATFYYAKGTPEPKWAFGKDPCAVIGRHIFFKDIT